MIFELFSNPIIFLIVAVTLILSISIHEFAHAFMADKLGDPTPRNMGRLTLNPLAHLDLLGTILLLTIGFGWGKPVSFNAFNLRNPRKDAALISFAGPLSNILLAVFLSVIFHLIQAQGFSALILFALIRTNLALAFFNLIPFEPLDGFKIVYGILPINFAMQWAQVQNYSTIILLIMILTRTTGAILDPLISFSLRLLGFNF